MPDSLLVAHLSAIYAAGERGDGARTMMQAVDGAAADLIGHRLFTIMVVHHATMEVERLYSNMPEAYPVAGRKKKRDTWWGGHVVEQGKPFVGAGPADLAKAFADHELIRSLGLNCVLNVPLRFDGLTRGTMNLLHTGEHYTPDHIGRARAIAQPLLPVMLVRSGKSV